MSMQFLLHKSNAPDVLEAINKLVFYLFYVQVYKLPIMW
jgi:hypothetical protein